MERKHALRETFRHYVSGQMNAKDAEAFLAHVQSGQDRELLEELIAETLGSPVGQRLLNDPNLLAILDESWSVLDKRIGVKPLTPHFRWRRIMGIAATVLCILGVGIGLYTKEQNDTSDHQQTIVPGMQAATLTLADGRKIRLSDADDGELAEDAGVRISKSKDGQLVYEILEDHNSTLAYNTLSTANGESYKVRMPDGTDVWLNAASTIRYPTNFSAHGKREVTLDGEAYFVVAKDTKRPFVVRSGDQEVQVLGTRFNVNSYKNEATIKTTVLAGAVQVSHRKTKEILRPGQQSDLTGTGDLIVRQVETDAVISWINNEFMFDGEGIETVMRKIARWYDADVRYEGTKTTEKFGGGLSRFESVDEVLQLLEKTGVVKFRIENKTIYVQSTE